MACSWLALTQEQTRAIRGMKCLPACASSKPEQLRGPDPATRAACFCRSSVPITRSGAHHKTTELCGERHATPVLTERFKDAAARLIRVFYVWFVRVVLRDFLFLFFVPGSSPVTPPSPIALRHVDPNVNSVVTCRTQTGGILTLIVCILSITGQYSSCCI